MKVYIVVEDEKDGNYYIHGVYTNRDRALEVAGLNVYMWVYERELDESEALYNENGS